VLGRLPRPDLIIYLDVPPAQAHRRLTERSSGQEETAYLRANDRAYRELPEFPAFEVVPGTGSVTQVQALVRQALRRHFPGAGIEIIVSRP